MSESPQPVSESPRIRTELDGRVLQIVVDNVRKKNAFVPEMMVALAEALTAFDRDDEQWVAVLCAAGEHTTAGLDMPKFFGPTASRIEAPADALDPFALKRRTLKPIVAQGGHALLRRAPRSTLPGTMTVRRQGDRR
jgi:enoyl-CoA hydratase/carnithine racemase